MALTFRILSARLEVRFRATSTETGQTREEAGSVDLLAPAVKTALGAARWEGLVKQAFRAVRGSFDLFAQQQAEIEAPAGEPFVPAPEEPAPEPVP